MSEVRKQLLCNLAGQRVLLVGGAGFIGHNLALTLRKCQAEVMVADNLMYNNLVSNMTQGGSLETLRRGLYQNFLIDRFKLMRDAGVELRNADARILQDLSQVFDEWQPSKVVHLSAIASAVEARRNPGLCFDLQLITLRNVLELCRMRKARIDVAFMSSSTVYGDFETPTVDETVRPRPRGIYANAKYMGERLLRTYADQHGIATVIIRPSALYGERCVSGRVSQKFIENALTGKPCLLEGGGDGRLDFTHVEDLTDGIACALGLEKSPGYTNTFNLTYGNARTIADLAEVLKLVVPNVILEERPRAEDKPIRGTLSVERAKSLLGFAPRYSLETGYKRYCEWYLEQWERAKRQLEAN
jgi:nucleoside-diphosphate-sugar epimerase